MNTSLSPSQRMLKILNRIKRENIVLRKMRMSKSKDEIKTMMDIYGSAWNKNWGFVPLTEEEIEYIAKKFKHLVDLSLIYIAELSGKPVAFVLLMRDYYKIIKHFNGELGFTKAIRLLLGRKKIDSARVMALGVKKEYRNMGIELLLCHKVLEIGRDIAKYLKTPTYAELSWTLEDNHSINKIIEEMSGVLYKKYRIYEVPIS